MDIDTGTFFVGIILLIIRLVNLGCLLYLIFKLFQEKGFFHALLGFLCCQLYPFIWGWLNSNTLKVLDWMALWTLTIVLEIVMAVGLFFLAPDIFFLLWGGTANPGFEGGF